MNLVIVESGAKAAKINKDLNSSKKLAHLGKFIVVACFGHIRDLKKKELGIDIADNFKPLFEITDDKRKTVSELKSKCAEASHIWLASDPDLEGEAIAESLVQVLKCKKYCRVTFNEINQKALERAFLQPRQINQQMVDAQLTRRIVDRLVGFELSPILWKQFDYKTYGALSAGRVQSATLNLLIQKENEITNFEKQQYWDFHGKFKFDPELNSEDKYQKELALHDGNKGNYKLNAIQDVKNFLKSIKNVWSIASIFTKTTSEKPKPPFITSTLQQEAHTKYKFSVDKTMQLAQALYEGGHITYLRTDSYNMSEDFQDTLRTFIEEKWGEEYVSDTIAKKKTSKNAQEAHECIRVTHLDVTDLSEEAKLTEEHVKLYKLIYERSLTCCMTPTLYDELHTQIKDASFTKEPVPKGTERSDSVLSDKTLHNNRENLYFSAVTKKVKFNGFQVVYGVENESENFDQMIEEYKATTITLEQINAKCNFTNPPPRYSEATLIKMLESEGIGRPSTYATIMNKLKEKNYMETKSIGGEKVEVTHLVYTPKPAIKERVAAVTVGGEKDKLVPTEIGNKVNQYLSADFNYILDKNFTALIEKNMDEVEKGTVEKLEVLTNFWNEFSPLLTKCKANFAPDEEKKERDPDPTIQGTTISYFRGKKAYVLKQDDRTAFLPIDTDISTITPEMANALFEFPKFIGIYKKEEVHLQKGQYGFYFSFKGKNYNVKEYTAEFDIEAAAKLIESGSEKVIKEWKHIGIYNGPYGPYIKSEKGICSVQKGTTVEEIKSWTEKECQAKLKEGLEYKAKIAKKK